MPLLYIQDDDTKKFITKYVNGVLGAFTKTKSSKGKTSVKNPINRMKPLDVVKVLMGIRSQRDSVKQFEYDGEFWAKLHEYDYEQLLTLTEEITHQYYMAKICSVQEKEEEEVAQQNKRRKISD